MVKKFTVTVLAVAVMALLMASTAEAGGPNRNQSGTMNNYTNTYRWAVQTVKVLQYRFMFMFGVQPADPGDPPQGWGPGDGTGNDGDGPQDGTGYGPGPGYGFQKYGECVYGGYGNSAYRLRVQQRGQ